MGALPAAGIRPHQLHSLLQRVVSIEKEHKMSMSFCPGYYKNILDINSELSFSNTGFSLKSKLFSRKINLR